MDLPNFKCFRHRCSKLMGSCIVSWHDLKACPEPAEKRSLETLGFSPCASLFFKRVTCPSG
jgi:hypothetical protein